MQERKPREHTVRDTGNLFRVRLAATFDQQGQIERRRNARRDIRRMAGSQFDFAVLQFFRAIYRPSGRNFRADAFADTIIGNGAHLRQDRLVATVGNFATGHAGAGIVAGEPLELYGTELNGGQIPGIDDFCVRHGLVFRRWSGGCLGAFLPEIVVFDGSGPMRDYTASEDEYLLFPPSWINSFTRLRELKRAMARAEFTVPPLVIA